MESISVRRAFDHAAQHYDRARRQLIPCFEEFYATVLQLVPYPAGSAIHFLDLGAGTGLLSLFLSEAFPAARFTLLDLSKEMLSLARVRFRASPERFGFVTADYASELPGRFDAVVSALSIHHLPDEDKRRLFGRIYQALPEGGIFINADQVLGATPEIEAAYRSTWLRQVRQRGVSEEDLTAAFERMEEDRMATLDSQLRWLAEAGFEQINCWYQHFSFVVYSGSKLPATALP